MVGCVITGRGIPLRRDVSDSRKRVTEIRDGRGMDAACKAKR